MFSEKQIDVEFALANGQFAGGGNSQRVSGLRVSCHIVNVGGFLAGQMEMTIWGLPLSTMNQLTTTGQDYLRMFNNMVRVFAGDENNMSLVWQGSLVSCFIDGQSPPDVCLRVTSLPGAFWSVQPAKPISSQGSVDAAGLIANLAQQMGMQFENAGVTAKLANPYYGGSPWYQAQQIAQDAGFDLAYDRGTLCAVPADKTRQGQAILIGPGINGMIGYPMFDQTSIELKALFNPAVQYQGEISVTSAIVSARGQWKVNTLEYTLESQMPSGRWEMFIQGVQIGPTVP